MKKIMSIAALFLITGTVSASIINVINGDHNVISGGSYTGLSGLGYSTNLFNDTSVGWSSALGSTNTIVVEQNAVDGANTAAVSSWLTGGGRMIVLGDYGSGNTSSFLSPILGASTSAGSVSYSASATKTASATGTSFADDAATLVYGSSTHPIASGNSGIDEVFYSGTGGDWVTRSAIGSGDLFYLAWDFCCTIAQADANSWYGTLDSAINYARTDVPEPSALILLGLGMIGLQWSRKNKVA